MEKLNLRIYKSKESAPNYGKLNEQGESWINGRLVSAAIIPDGTHRGNPTVDFVVKTSDGQDVIIITAGETIKALAVAIKTLEKHN